MKSLVILLSIFFCLKGFAQTQAPSEIFHPLDSAEQEKKTEVSFEEFWTSVNTAINKGEKKVAVKNKVIYSEKAGGEYPSTAEVLPFFSLRGNEDLELDFQNCTFRMNLNWGDEIKKIRRIDFVGCDFEGDFNVHFETQTVPKIKDCRFKKFSGKFNIQNQADFTGNFHTDPAVFWIQDCVFETFYLAETHSKPIGIKIENNLFKGPGESVLICASPESADIIGNDFQHSNLTLRLDEVKDFDFEKNSLMNLAIMGTVVSDHFDMLENKMSGNFITQNLVLPVNSYTRLDWAILDKGHVGIQNNHTLSVKVDSMNFINGLSHEQAGNEQDFKNLMALYGRFVQIYKEANDMESYNRCYIMMKDIQSKRLEHFYLTKRTTGSWVRWKFWLVLKFYVTYGTDPSRGLLVSLYIVILFSVFYFFFPSDWDETSKGRMISNFKDFVQKNDKGYLKPLLKLAKGFSLSFLNAFTLSINSFITIGFGNIPTRGAARYVCIFEGLIGWFLLTIFTVSLINQIM